MEETQDYPTGYGESPKKKDHKFGGYKDASKPRPGYYVTPSRVYYRGVVIDGALPSSFHKLGSSWAKDDKSVYFAGERVPGVDVKTFRVENKFGVDKKTRYYRGEKVK